MFELRLQCPQSEVELVSDALMALDALSVSVEDADAHTDQEQALFGEPNMPAPAAGWLRSHLIALFATEALAQDAAKLLSLQPFFADCALVGIQPVPEQDWVRLTQSQFEPVPITPLFWVVPTWHEPPDEARWVMRLDPGLAFGTGTHPTTRMCLRWIAEHPPVDQRVLDYGCGSGILAIGAAMLGAAQVDAVDIDPDAVCAAQLNAQANHVALNLGIRHLSFGGGQHLGCPPQSVGAFAVQPCRPWRHLAVGWHFGTPNGGDSNGLPIAFDAASGRCPRRLGAHAWQGALISFMHC